MDSKRNLTTLQAAQLLECSPSTVLNMIRRGSLRAAKLDPTTKSVFLIPQAEVTRLLKERDARFQGKVLQKA